jgi:predicted phosphate transport protein (TIGR00153 family)
MQADLAGLFAEAGANLQRAGEGISELLLSWPESRGLVGEIGRCEQEGDRITREIIHGLHRGMIAADDRGDIHALAEAIDDVVDEIEEASQELAAYGIEAPMEQAQELAGIVRDSARALGRSLGELDRVDSIERGAVEIRDLEHEGDRVYRQAVASLFDGGIDPMMVIRWKDIFETLEAAVDACETVANVLEGMTLKRANRH